MLKDLVNGKLETRICMIEDGVVSEGIVLFGAFLKHHLQFDNVCLICFEEPPVYYKTRFGVPDGVCIDLFSDPLDWNNTAQTRSVDSVDLTELTAGRKTVFIDSVSSMIIRKGFHLAYRELFRLSKSVNKMICLYHGDILNDQGYRDKLGYLSTCLLKLFSIPKPGELVHIFFKKPGGKLLIKEETYFIHENYTVSFEIPKQKAKPSSAAVGKIDLAELTTFNLGIDMSATEKVAKDQLVLPYLRNKPSSGESKILYEAEAEDNLEDDPDDDLDI